ncbi:UDP-N-acetylmuramate dehydrogenase [Blochmannia endosymbiont of Polyrhachis (Hedomyrma) turneri]|uniref:UDP-N-acetylmuramate dehydrogenase n=1 Tax=Blochmannia endosymbiont of Polyrhachis (Hedomyrma) turneri TaxID=1505596 RepID=UPI00061A8124|nr:UDP-N-acetylmuramate dehydrogenase [Blochmannia endosymbiont of Polyrhachis (Hedomyrma) turneri]AKC59765.1 UDP-N-acetylenolpyruvoylglucosamine reductase [Blochmannia endosymbiont of Polyrhachis (Hedomyrma) turneri]
MIKNRVSLKSLNTFSLRVYADYVIKVYTEGDLLIFWNRFVQKGYSVLILGRGSNVLFLEDYCGVILLNRIKGIDLHEDKYYWYLHVCSGELWHELVVYSLKNNMPGLENLALIPGCVGAAPIQNIGAYGVELQKFCEYVDILNLDIGEKIRFTVDECQFGYRYSIFMEQFKFNYVIVAVGLKLSKTWRPVLNYIGLDKLNINSVTPVGIFNAVCIMRQYKLPDPLVFGNAGSFFKNPVINCALMDDLLNDYPDMPCFFYKQNLVKLSAGWLIENCNLSVSTCGYASIYKKQSLILININQQATAGEIVTLAGRIYEKVMDYFHISLEPEVRFIADFGEIDSVQLLSTGKKVLRK